MSLTMLGDLTHRPDQRRGACVLIAIKQRVHCKTRLAQALAPRARVQLVRSMLALTQAHRVLREFGCREVVILPADLPTITAAEIDALVRAGRRGGFAIAPDAAGVGTNALCLVSAQPFRFQFGSDSQQLHLEEAERTGLSPQVVRLPGLEFDVDSPADLHRLLGQQRWLARLQA